MVSSLVTPATRPWMLLVLMARTFFYQNSGIANLRIARLVGTTISVNISFHFQTTSRIQKNHSAANVSVFFPIMNCTGLSWSEANRQLSSPIQLLPSFSKKFARATWLLHPLCYHQLCANVSFLLGVLSIGQMCCQFHTVLCFPHFLALLSCRCLCRTREGGEK